MSELEIMYISYVVYAWNQIYLTTYGQSLCKRFIGRAVKFITLSLRIYSGLNKNGYSLQQREKK